MKINSTLTAPTIEPEMETLSKDAPLTFGKGIWYGIQFLLLQFAITIPIAIIGFGLYGMSNQAAANNFIISLGLPIAFIGCAWFFYKKSGLIATVFQWKGSFIKLIPISLLLIFSMSYIIGQIMTYLPGYEAMLESYKAMFAGVNPITLLVGAALIGPICEEIIFRGIILEGLSKKYNPINAIVFSAFIFGIVHLHPLQVINAFFIGLVFGWIYLKTQSLWVCIVAHVLYNGIALSGDIEETESVRAYFDNDLLYFASFSLAALVIFLTYKGIQKVTTSKSA